MPFDVWAARMGAAATENDRRRLLAEIGAWKVGRLTDIPAQREAAWALSKLYAALGEPDPAAREARGLLSLCQTPPLATPEELAAARSWLSSLGQKGVVAGIGASIPKPKAKAPKQREPREQPAPRREAPRGPDPLDLGRDALQRGAWAEAQSALADRKGATAALLRATAALQEALVAPDRDARLAALAADLLADATTSPVRAPAAPAAPSAPTHPLEQLVGQAVPKPWKARLRVLEDWLAGHPHRVDELASLALDHHIEVSGDKEPAPWLITPVALALAAGGPRVRETIARLSGRGAWAVTAYEEWPFELLVGVVKAAAARGWSPLSLRRGVLSRGEPRDRRLWTLRLATPGGERLVVAGAPATEPYEAGAAERLAERVHELSPDAVLVAPGDGNADLRAAAATKGLRVVEETDAAAILDAAPAAPPAPERPDPLAALRAAVTADVLDDDALTAAVAPIRRAGAALAAATDAASGLPDSAARIAKVILALHRTVPDGVPLQEGVTAAIQLAADGSAEALALLTDPETAGRLGGPGATGLVELVRALGTGGWSVTRVFRGPTARERRDGPVIEALGAHTSGLWRLRAERGEDAVEVWFLDEPSPEARAAAPQLLRTERARLVVLADDSLSAWYASIGGPTPVVWGDPAALLAALP